MKTTRLPARYRSIIERRLDALVRETIATFSEADWSLDEDSEREVVIRISLEKKPTRQPIKAKGRRRFPEGEDADYLQYLRGLSCAVAGRYALPTDPGGVSLRHVCEGVIEAHHIKTRGAGGPDRWAIPLCSLAHQQFHQWGRWTFARRYGCDYARLVARLIVDYETKARVA